MFKTTISVAIAAAVTLTAGSALAANNTAVITITQDDVSTSWEEDISGLLVRTGNNFSIADNTNGNYFQNGQFVADASLSHPDYWKWNASTASWDWTSTQTATELSLKKISGNGDPDLSYDIYAKNKNSVAQTYTFTTVEKIVPVVSSANVVHADLTTDMANTNSATQKFELSSDGGSTFTNAGVDISAANAGTFMADASGPTATSWDYMRIVTTFKLAANTNTLTEFAGYASITPVPEPESYAMMLSGLVLLAGMAYRRKF